VQAFKDGRRHKKDTHYIYSPNVPSDPRVANRLGNADEAISNDLAIDPSRKSTAF
jgi:hypothetical protein